MAYYLGREKKASAYTSSPKEDTFVSANGNDKGRTIHSVRNRFSILRISCLRYNEMLKDNNMDTEAANLAYAATFGCEFNFLEAYEVLYRCIC
ncbi:hypothetical protein MKW98_007146 [Papaver atlanticum]|uniref:Uncharacterized protein n=1 Tax=Papaver atlanticum TaxID=357466 RepID=A0AAD4SLF7_9MAGN|nr:hypothetical protein MKW98_007146 [Papaver atlanticum]